MDAMVNAAASSDLALLKSNEETDKKETESENPGISRTKIEENILQMIRLQ